MGRRRGRGRAFHRRGARIGEGTLATCGQLLGDQSSISLREPWKKSSASPALRCFSMSCCADLDVHALGQGILGDQPQQELGVDGRRGDAEAIDADGGFDIRGDAREALEVGADFRLSSSP